MANRLTVTSGSVADAAVYSYAPNNQRVWRGVWVSGSQTVDEVTYYAPSGAKLAAYDLSGTYSQFQGVATGYYEYFGGKMLKNAQGWVNQDRLGSIGKYFPYGQERPSATSNGKEKFATYFRDAETGLDYAQNRYHSAGDGRFLTADPYQASGGPGDPGSWNRYAYVGGDPVNFNDPKGLYRDCLPGSHAVNNADGEGYCQRDDDDSGSIAKACANPGSVNMDPTIWEVMCSNGAGVSPSTTVQTSASTGTGGHLGAVAAKDEVLRTTFSASCELNFLGLGITVDDVKDKLNNALIVDGLYATDNVRTLLPSNLPAQQYSLDLQVSNVTGSFGSSIKDWFSKAPTVHAAAQLGGRSIFINSSFTSDPDQAVYTIFHETLHLMGFSDQQLAANWGIVLQPGNTEVLTDYLRKTCQ